MSAPPTSAEPINPPLDDPSTHPEPGAQANTAPSTASHPPRDKPDPTVTGDPSLSHPSDARSGGRIDNAPERELSATSAAGPTELARLKVDLRDGLRQFPDFPSPGVLFEDIMPIFASHALFTSLVRALELQVAAAFPARPGERSGVDVVVGLESRGFLCGPTLALRLGAGFVPVRKRGKLPGRCATETFRKEYGEDVFQMQEDAFPRGARVLVVDDIIATGGSAAAAGNLVRKLGGHLLGYLFLMELDFLKGRDKLDAPVHTLLSGQEEKLNGA